jgi:endonuclease/exonuclease/phosphatase (EEP) superfamily protein YafD
VAASAILGIVLLALAFRLGAASMWWIEILRYVPFPVYLVPAAAALVASAWLGWAWRVAAGAALAIVLTVVMGLATGTADEGGDPLRFMTWNVKAYVALHQSEGFARVAWEVANADPDILVMQDASAIAAHPEAAAPLRAALAGRQVYVEDQYLVASRFPLKDCRPGSLATGDETTEYVRCTVTVRGRDLDVFTAHFLSPREGLNAARGRERGGLEEWQYNVTVRLAQADLLVKGLVQARRPLVVAGDFNADEHSPIVRRLLDLGLRDAWSSAAFGYGYTYGHDLRPGFSFLRIDHVLASPDVGVGSCRTGGSEASQHRPVICELLLERRG